MRLEKEVNLVLQLRVTLSPSITGRAGLSRITEPAEQHYRMFRSRINAKLYWWYLHTINLPVTVMLTVLLLFPPPASHQYSPLSDWKTKSMVQVTVDVTVSFEHFGMNSLMVLTLHPADTLKPSQVKWTDSYSKSCSLVGTIRKAASETEKWRTQLRKNLVSRQIQGAFYNKREIKKQLKNLQLKKTLSMP